MINRNLGTGGHRRPLGSASSRRRTRDPDILQRLDERRERFPVEEPNGLVFLSAGGERDVIDPSVCGNLYVDSSAFESGIAHGVQ